MKKGIIGIIIAIIVAGGAYATYHAVNANAKPVQTATANNVVTTQHQAATADNGKTTQVVSNSIKPTDVTSTTTNKAKAIPIVDNKTNAKTSVTKTTNETPKDTSTSATVTSNTKPLDNNSASNSTQADKPQQTNVPVKKDVTTTSGTINNDFNKIKALPIYKSNAKYKTAVDQMYQLLAANNLENNAYMYQICSQPEQYKKVQTEGLMGMVTLKVTKNQDLMQKIVNQYGWIQASVLNS